MNPAPLSDDVLFGIACMQDYRDTVDTDTEDGKQLWDDVSRRIERLFKFYYQLVGFDPNNIRKVNLSEID